MKLTKPELKKYIREPCVDVFQKQLRSKRKFIKFEKVSLEWFTPWLWLLLLYRNAFARNFISFLLLSFSLQFDSLGFRSNQFNQKPSHNVGYSIALCHIFMREFLYGELQYYYHHQHHHPANEET